MLLYTLLIYSYVVALILAFLTQHVTCAEAENLPVDSAERLTQPDVESEKVFQHLPDDRSSKSKLVIPGQAQYNEAFDLLSSVKLPKRRLARYNKPASVFGSVTYYAKQIFSLLFMNGPKHDGISVGSLNPTLTTAVALLQEASSHGYDAATFELAEMNFYGLYTHPRNYAAAFEYYQELADVDGNSTAQHMIGFMYATGIGSAVNADQAKALLYHTFAADADVPDPRAIMTTAYRHHTGIGTSRDCEKAVHYYKQIADIAMAWARAGPPGGQSMSKEAYRLAENDGGVYGEGASVSSSGDNAKRSGPTHDANAAFDDVLEYLDLMSRKGELKAIFSLGRLHYDGSRVLQRNYRIAADKFFDVARRYWDKNGKIRPDTEPGVEKLASKAAGYLGRMFLRGEGLEQNFQIARVWFNRGIANGDALCQYSMGLIHLHGLGVTADPVKAAGFFGAAADQDFPVAQVRLGVLLMDQGDLPLATKYFGLAARSGHIEALYYMAEIYQLGANGQPRNCGQAATFYKLVAEKAEEVHSNFSEANDAYEDGDVDTAILHYMMAAEQGYEAAQANVAYLLDHSIMQKSQLAQFFAGLLPSLSLRLPFLSTSLSTSSSVAQVGTATSLGNAYLALVYWTRSAKDGNIDSLLKMGDYYLAGVGVHPTAPVTLTSTNDSALPEKDTTPKSNATDDHAKAAACYIAASESYQSAQALFNLGWMHENGVGLAQDFHLAKRYYDQAATPPMREAQAPVALALIKLRVRSWWNWLSGGSVNGIREADDAVKARRAQRGFWEWLGEFLAADLELYDQERRAAEEANVDGDNYLDEWGRTLNGGYGGDGDEEDWDDTVGDLVETLVIVAFAALLAALVWYRQTIAARQRVREQEQRQVQLQQQQQQQAAILPGGQMTIPIGTEDATQEPPVTEQRVVQDDDDARHLFERGPPPPDLR